MARPRKYNISLTDDEVKKLKSIMHKKQTSKTVRNRCQIILDLDDAHGKVLTHEQSAKTNCVCMATIMNTVKLYSEKGIQGIVTLNRNVNSDNAHRKLDGRAEARIIEEMTPFISGEFTVSDVKRANFSELFPSNEDAADRWFKFKLYYITLDEKNGAENRVATNILVQAADLRDSIVKMDEGMKGTMADYVIASVTETAIMDVYYYEAGPDSHKSYISDNEDEAEDED